MTRLFRSIVGFLSLSILFFALQLNAQTTAVASVDGIIRDATGNVIVNAQVTMTEIAKGLIRTTLTNTEGGYTFPNLPVGPYRLEVTVPDSRTTHKRARAAGNNNIQINVAMQVGSLSEKVEVTAAASMVETKENSISWSSIAAHQRLAAERPAGHPVDHEPGRRVLRRRRRHRQQDLLQFHPDFRRGRAGQRHRVPVGRRRQHRRHVERQSSLSRSRTPCRSSALRPAPCPRVSASIPGATVNVVTKSGSNAFHGDLFEYLRNGDLNARNFFATKARQPEAKSVRRNRRRQRSSATSCSSLAGIRAHINRSNPPSTYDAHSRRHAMLNGDFSAIASAACRRQTVDESVRRRRAVSGQPDSSRVAQPVAMKIATQYLPIASADQCGNVTYGIPITGDENQYIGRVDWLQSSKHTAVWKVFRGYLQESGHLRRQESADHYPGRQPRDGAVLDRRRQLHLRSRDAELVPRYLQPPAR